MKVTVKTKAKASLKLLNAINSYLFEQEYMELKEFPKAKEALKMAQKELANIIRVTQ